MGAGARKRVFSLTLIAPRFWHSSVENYLDFHEIKEDSSDFENGNDNVAEREVSEGDHNGTNELVECCNQKSAICLDERITGVYAFRQFGLQ